MWEDDIASMNDKNVSTVTSSFVVDMEYLGEVLVLASIDFDLQFTSRLRSPLGNFFWWFPSLQLPLSYPRNLWVLLYNVVLVVNDLVIGFSNRVITVFGSLWLPTEWDISS